MFSLFKGNCTVVVFALGQYLSELITENIKLLALNFIVLWVCAVMVKETDCK